MLFQARVMEQETEADRLKRVTDERAASAEAEARAKREEVAAEKTKKMEEQAQRLKKMMGGGGGGGAAGTTTTTATTMAMATTTTAARTTVRAKVPMASAPPLDAAGVAAGVAIMGDEDLDKQDRLDWLDDTACGRSMTLAGLLALVKAMEVKAEKLRAVELLAPRYWYGIAIRHGTQLFACY
jgi:hypothetical protein